jgi:hypothetical protein
MGKPVFEVDDLKLRIIEDMAGRGAVLDDIAYVLGCSPITLDRLKNGYQRQTKARIVEVAPDDRVALAYNRGRALVRDRVAGRLLDLVDAGDTAATIFWLKAQAGWSDRPVEAASSSTGNVVIYLPENGRNPVSV